MRRTMAVFALAGVWLLLLAVPAAAHPGIENPFLPTHVATTVALGVPSEEASPMVEIDVTLPGDFTLLRVDSVPGWQSEQGPGRVRYFGGDVAQGGYAQFTFSGVFASKRVVSLPVVTRAADGTTVTWSGPPGDAHPAAVAFPGFPPGSSPVPGVSAVTGGGGRGGAPGAAPTIAVVAAAAGAGALALAWALARRRAAAALAAAEG